MTNPVQNKTENSSDTRRKRPTGQRKQVYVPDIFEASVLNQLHENWRFFEDKKAFDAKMAELAEQKVDIEEIPVSKTDIARVNTLLDIGEKPEDYSSESILAAEQKVRADKTLWNKLQAIHLYNSLGFKLKIAEHQQFENADAVYALLQKKLEKIAKGTFIDGKYEPSKMEKNILRTLRNYGKSIRNPQTENDLENYFSKINNALAQIMKRDDFRYAPKKEKTDRKDKPMTDTPAFELTDEDKKYFAEHNVPESEWSQVKDADSLAKLKDQYKDNVAGSGGNGGNGSDGGNGGNGGDDLNVTINDGTENTNENKNDNQPEPEWVKRKAEYYSQLAKDGKISDYQQDTSKEGFAAKFNNAEIHYTSPNDVSVSKDAGYAVFDTMLKEPDNKGRPVNFPENASKEIATRLYAACVMNGNPMSGAIPQELDAQTLADCGLSPEDIKKIQDTHAQQHPKNQENSNDDKGKETAEPDTNKLSEDDKKKLAKRQELLNTAAQLGMETETFVSLGTRMPKLVADKNIQPLDDAQKAEFIKNMEPKKLKALLKQPYMKDGLIQTYPNKTKIMTDAQKATLKLLKNQDLVNDENNVQKMVKELSAMQKDGKIDVSFDQDGNRVVTAKNCSPEELEKATKMAQDTDELIKDTTIRRNIQKMDKYRQDFEQLKADGKIAIATDKDGKPQIVAGPNGNDNDAKNATQLMKDAADLRRKTSEINSGKPTVHKDNNGNDVSVYKNETQEQRNVQETLRQQQIEGIRSRLSADQLTAHDTKVEQRDLVIAARLGIAPEGAKVVDHRGEEVKAKTGDDLNKYKATLSKETMARLTQKFGKGPQK